MPSMPCLDCGALTSSSRCRRCRKARQLARRGTSTNQRSFRAATLAKTGGRCAICGSRDGVIAHHVRPLAEGGTDTDGGVPLCRAHHRLAHR